VRMVAARFGLGASGGASSCAARASCRHDVWVIACGLAIGTDYSQVDISGDRLELLGAKVLLERLHPGDHVEVRCDGLPAVAWDARLLVLEFTVANAQDLRVVVNESRLHVELDSEGCEMLASVFEAVATDALRTSMSHAHVEHIEGVDDRVASDSRPLIISGPGSHADAEFERLLRCLLEGRHDRHPICAAQLAPMVREQPHRLSYAVHIVVRALLTDDSTLCQEGLVALLELLLVPPVPAWGIEYVMESLLPILDAGPEQGLYAAVERVIDRWTRPRR
jgi:hypothetical protein